MHKVSNKRHEELEMLANQMLMDNDCLENSDVDNMEIQLDERAWRKLMEEKSLQMYVNFKQEDDNL